MPNRILRESICTSETINQLTDAEESFFYRLLVVCDDFGRMDARPAVLRSRLYPMRIDKVSLDDVAHLLQGFADAGLVAVYYHDGKPYLQIVTWDRYQQRRAKHSKYPTLQADDSTCAHMQADDSTCTPRNRGVEESRNRGVEESSADDCKDDFIPDDEKKISGRPYVKQCFAWWAKQFTQPLEPSTYSIAPAKLDELEQAVTVWIKTRGQPVSELWDELESRLGPAGESTITGFRKSLQEIVGTPNTKWHGRAIAYLVKAITGIAGQGRFTGKLATAQKQMAYAAPRDPVPPVTF